MLRIRLDLKNLSTGSQRYFEDLQNKILSTVALHQDRVKTLLS